MDFSSRELYTYFAFNARISGIGGSEEIYNFRDSLTPPNFAHFYQIFSGTCN